MDKEFWRSIADNDYQLPQGYTLEQLTPELLTLLGTNDPEMRDYFIYTTLENWIQRGLYNSEQLRAMRVQLLDNLLAGLGERNATDATNTLLRSFSALTLSELLKYENAHPFLSREEVQQTLEQSINYIMNEQDLRGHVRGIGWVHALAHAGDLLGVLARNHHVGLRELERILTAIAEKTTVPTEYLYVSIEDERLALVVIAVLTRKLIPASYWSWWCRHMAEIGDKMPWEDIVHFARPEDSNAYHNTRLFLHALYLQLTLAHYKLPGSTELVAAITRTLYQLDPGFYSPEVIKIIDPDIDLEQL
ncbi:DUF2785 domain-containing protein [Ktedonobacteria bacterium brp13]|nr:DUF2785 domain-containing protein [Ktedonobacteria bacterium brp13]